MWPQFLGKQSGWPYQRGTTKFCLVFFWCRAKQGPQKLFHSPTASAFLLNVSFHQGSNKTFFHQLKLLIYPDITCSTVVPMLHLTAHNTRTQVLVTFLFQEKNPEYNKINSVNIIRHITAMTDKDIILFWELKPIFFGSQLTLPYSTMQYNFYFTCAL